MFIIIYTTIYQNHVNCSNFIDKLWQFTGHASLRHGHFASENRESVIVQHKFRIENAGKVVKNIYLIMSIYPTDETKTHIFIGTVKLEGVNRVVVLTNGDGNVCLARVV